MVVVLRFADKAPERAIVLKLILILNRNANYPLFFSFVVKPEI